MKHALLCTVVAAAAVGFSLRSDLESQTLMWGVLLGAYALLGAWAAWQLHKMGTLTSFLAFRRGDPTMGILTGVGLLAAGWLLRNAVVPPGSAGYAWLFNIFTRIGDVEGSPKLTVIVLSLVFLEELVWRGLVLQELTQKLGMRRAFPLSAVFYALAQVPTVMTLSDADAGPNPLLFIAALGCGLVWSYLALSSQRIWRSLFSHGIFTYFGAAWLIGPPNVLGGFASLL